NGFHLRYLIDLANNEAATELVRRVLQAADQRFSDGRVQIDPTLFNAARIIKLSGTLSRKGDHTDERPHRRSAVLSVPDHLYGVPPEALERFAAEYRPPEPTARPSRQIEANGTGRTGADPAARARAYIFAPGFPESIAGSNGHGALYRAACELVDGFGLDRGTAISILTEWNEAKAHPSESAYQIAHKIDDALKNHPRPSLGRLDAERAASSAQVNGNSKAATAANGSGNGKAIDFGGLSDADLGIVTASGIQAQRIQWLWEYRLARGELALMAGEGGLGKSQLLLATAAIISRGDEFPDGSGRAPKGRTVILSAEDCPETTIIPRLVALGADLDRITIVKAQFVIRKDGQEPTVNPVSLQNLDYWRAVFDRLPDTVLFIVDPLPSYLGRGVNDSKNAEIRGVLEPFLDSTIRPRKICVFANTHLNKSAEIKTPVHRITGSIAYANIPRNVHLVVRDPERPDRRYFKQCKCNNAPDELPALAFQVVRRTIQGADGEIEAAIPVFEAETVSVDLRALICGETKRRGPQPVKLDELVRFLFDFLRGKGPVLLAEIGEAAGKADLIGKQVWDDKKGRNRWSNFSSLYDAAARVADLPPPDHGWEVATSKTEPSLRSTAGHARWLL
ncbi:MAG: AAA family ATPase, partial [Isosphaeraceae bacterium]